MKRTKEFKWRERGRKRQGKDEVGKIKMRSTMENGGVYQYVFVVFKI